MENLAPKMSGVRDAYPFMYKYISLSMCVCMYVCMYVRTYVCMYVCLYICWYVCMHVFMYSCTHVLYSCTNVRVIMSAFMYEQKRYVSISASIHLPLSSCSSA